MRCAGLRQQVHVAHATDITDNPEVVARQPRHPAATAAAADGWREHLALSWKRALRVFINSSAAQCERTSVDLDGAGLNGWTQTAAVVVLFCVADVIRRRVRFMAVDGRT